jgi:hypothetical protein
MALVLGFCVAVSAARQTQEPIQATRSVIPRVAFGSWQRVTPAMRATQRLQEVARTPSAPRATSVDSIVLSSLWLSPGIDSTVVLDFTFWVQAPSVAVVLVTQPGQMTAIDSVLSDSLSGTGVRAVSGGWNGRNLSGAIVADGPYDLVFMEIDTLQNVRSNRRQITVDTVAPVLNLISIVPRTFAPTAPGAAQHIEVRFSVSQSQAAFDAVGVDLVTDQGFLAIPLVGAFAGNGDYVARCFNCGDSLSDGITGVEVWSADLALNSNTLVDSIDANLLGPEVTLSHPSGDDETITQQADSLVGMVADRHAIASLSLIVSGALDTTLSLSATPAPDSTQLAFSVDLSQLLAAEGLYQLNLPAVDTDSVSDSTLTLSYRVDRTPPPAAVLSPPLPATTRASTIAISVLVDSTASVLFVNGQSNQINGRDVLPFPQFPLVPGVNTLRFEVVDFAGNRSPIETATVFRETTEGISAAERFRAGQTITIDAGVVATSVSVRIMATDGTLVRTFSSVAARREYSFTWDLKTPEGLRVRNGPYLLVATVNANSTVQYYRKMIAVIE